MDKIHAYEKELGEYLYEKLAAIEGVSVYGYNIAQLCFAQIATTAAAAAALSTRPCPLIIAVPTTLCA